MWRDQGALGIEGLGDFQDPKGGGQRNGVLVALLGGDLPHFSPRSPGPSPGLFPLVSQLFLFHPWTHTQNLKASLSLKLPPGGGQGQYQFLCHCVWFEKFIFTW